jgi:SH3-like domain-containing protein
MGLSFRLIFQKKFLVFSIVLMSLFVFRSSVGIADLGRETGLQVPRFVSLSSNKINVRAGPGMRYPIKWIFQRKNLPVKIIAESGTWRKIKDHEGIEGWVHQRMLSGRRWAIILGETTLIRKDKKNTAPGVARFEAGVIASLGKCAKEWCFIEASSYSGWVHSNKIWGVSSNEDD